MRRVCSLPGCAFHAAEQCTNALCAAAGEGVAHSTLYAGCEWTKIREQVPLWRPDTTADPSDWWAVMPMEALTSELLEGSMAAHLASLEGATSDYALHAVLMVRSMPLHCSPVCLLHLTHCLPHSLYALTSSTACLRCVHAIACTSEDQRIRKTRRGHARRRS